MVSLIWHQIIMTLWSKRFTTVSKKYLSLAKKVPNGLNFNLNKWETFRKKIPHTCKVDFII